MLQHHRYLVPMFQVSPYSTYYTYLMVSTAALNPDSILNIFLRDGLFTKSIFYKVKLGNATTMTVSVFPSHKVQQYTVQPAIPQQGGNPSA